MLIAGEEDVAPALADHWQDVYRGLPRRGRPPPVRRARRRSSPQLDERVRIRLSSIDQDQPFAFRAQAADIAARGLKEAEPELEKLARSGYRTVVAFARRGEGERVAYNLGPAEGPLARATAPTAGRDAAGADHASPRRGCRPGSSRRSSTWR